MLEKTLAGVPGTGSRLAMGAKTLAGEIASEVPEEVGGKMSQNLAMKEVKPEQSIMEGTGETAAMAVLGAGALGGATGLASRGTAPETAAPPEPEPIQPTEPPLLVAPKRPDDFALPALPKPNEFTAIPLLGGPNESPQQGKPTEPVEPDVPDTGTTIPPTDVPPPRPPAPIFTPEEEAALVDCTNGLPTESTNVFEGLQNRDRAKIGRAHV